MRFINLPFTSLKDLACDVISRKVDLWYRLVEEFAQQLSTLLQIYCAKMTAATKGRTRAIFVSDRIVLKKTT